MHEATLTELLILALATWQAVEVWHHGELFAPWRAEVELWDGWFWLGSLLLCPWCLSLWAAWLLSLLWWAPVLCVVPLGLAASRLANLGNDLTHAWCRTPGSKSRFEVPPDDVRRDLPDDTAGQAGEEAPALPTPAGEWRYTSY